MESLMSPPLDPTSLLVGGAVGLLSLLWWLSTRRPPGLPPGPGPALPLLGHLHLMPKDPRAQLWTWRRQYGDVFSLYMGGTLVVVLASYSAIREALVTFADVFSHRPHSFLMAKISNNKGIISTSGPKWKEQRKTSLEILRAIGMGKNVLAEKIQEEITHYIQAIKDHQGAPAKLHRLTLMSVSNISCNILFGRRFRYHDPDFSRYLDLQDQTSQLIGNSAPLNFFPFLQYLPGDLFHVKRVAENTLTIQKFIREQVQQHTENYHASVEPRDFIHAYLRQVYKRQEQGDTVTSLDETNLIHSCFDLYAGGTETVTTTIAWALLFLLHHPHVQQKCHREIRDTLGPRPILSITDKAAMPYVEATVMEVQRKANVVPLGLLHGLARDVNFRGYVIPQDAAVMPGLEMVLNDPDIWSDPENFRPERFIGADGKVTRKGEFMPFCVGRRMCPGESLARMELFLYLATLIQHFHFLPPEEGQLPSLEGIMGLTHIPKPFKVRAEIRK